eukprot:5263947-Pyramimonas_sp.AAC.1
MKRSNSKTVLTERFFFFGPIAGAYHQVPPDGGQEEHLPHPEPQVGRAVQQQAPLPGGAPAAREGRHTSAHALKLPNARQ